VLDNLRAVFGTRAGSALVAADYGIVSVTDIVHSCPNAIDDVVKSLRQAIKTYEPRLVNVVVRHVGGADGRDVVISFEISGDLIDNGKKVPVKITTVIDAARKVIVK